LPTSNHKSLGEVLQPLKATSVEELQEQADEVDYLTPREFAKLIGVKPQQVYAWLRKGILDAERCKCGRTILCVSKSQATLAARKIARGEVVDSRPDAPGDEGSGVDVHEDMPQKDRLF
jgi:hypothetical protein